MKTSEFTGKHSQLEKSGQKDRRELLILVDALCKFSGYSKIRFHPEVNQCCLIEISQNITNKNAFHHQRSNWLKRQLKMTCYYSVK